MKVFLTVLGLFAVASAIRDPFNPRKRQSPSAIPPSSWPHAYPGMPLGDYGSNWQSYFSVNSTLLPNVTVNFTSYAGNIATDTPGHPNNTLFFWAAEHEGHPGSLTARPGEREEQPWILFLSGGPGSSSLLGFLLENGPLRLTNDLTYEKNNYSYSLLADTIWVDNPVGTGFATADGDGYATNETRLADDFIGFLTNLVKVFPSLKTRPLILSGESYAGYYVPYISKALIEDSDPPVKLAKSVLGDAVLAADASCDQAPTLSMIDLYPELINYSPDVYNEFLSEHINCGYDVHLKYPQPAALQPMPVAPATDPYSPYNSALSPVAFAAGTAQRFSALRSLLHRGESSRKRDWLSKRGLVGAVNATELDPWYGCFLLYKLFDYVYNYTLPWEGVGFNPYDIPDALNPDFPSDTPANIQPFLQDNRTVAALHAPTSQLYEAQISYAFPQGDNSSASITFLSEIANAVPLVFYSGNDDALVPRLGTEFAIQNTTFGGIRGFTRRPSTPWYTDDGSFAGIVHQERNVTYGLFRAAGHQVPLFAPEAAFVFLREFILGKNKTGAVVMGRNGTTTVIGGENASLSASGIAGGPIYTGSATSIGTYSWPSQTVAAWSTFVATRTPRAFDS